MTLSEEADCAAEGGENLNKARARVELRWTRVAGGCCPVPNITVVQSQFQNFLQPTNLPVIVDGILALRAEIVMTRGSQTLLYSRMGAREPI